MTASTVATGTPQFRATLFRSALYEALALAFAYPSALQHERLITLLEDMLEFDVDTASELPAAARAMLKTLRAADVTTLSAEHTRLFEQSELCSPFETEYEVDPFAKARQLADISGFYQAFGMDVSRERPTTQDFIGTECEFMSLLSRMEGYAGARRWTRRREVALDAQRAFLRDHLGRWERALVGDMRKATVDPQRPEQRFFTLAAELCERFVEDDLRRFQARPLRLKQRMLADRSALDCPVAPPVSPLETGSLAEGDALGALESDR